MTTLPRPQFTPVKPVKDEPNLATAAAQRLQPAFLQGQSSYIGSGARKRGPAFSMSSYGSNKK